MRIGVTKNVLNVKWRPVYAEETGWDLYPVESSCADDMHECSARI